MDLRGDGVRLPCEQQSAASEPDDHPGHRQHGDQQAPGRDQNSSRYAGDAPAVKWKLKLEKDIARRACAGNAL